MTNDLKHWTAIVDPIAFKGGSKIASHSLLSTLNIEHESVIVFTRDPNFWKGTEYQYYRLYEFSFLANAEQGLAYFIRHFFILLQLWMWTAYLGNPRALIGISGPGVDLAAYWTSRKLNIPLIQLVHGPVAKSNTIRKNLALAKIVACLDSEYNNVLQLISDAKAVIAPKVVPMKNGIAKAHWPKPSNDSFTTAHFFWSASLLKWKGLELFLAAFNSHSVQNYSRATICFIKPKQTTLPVSRSPENRPNLDVFENPQNLDEIRSRCNIFVSSSLNEPFGLSILEALAAGLCVIIPRDGSYWDANLTHGINCVKYEAQNELDLLSTLEWTIQNMAQVKDIALEGQKLSKNYAAEPMYKNVATAMNGILAAEKDSP